MDAPVPESPVPSPTVVVIPTRGERQAMDWSLALASQDIPCAIRPPGERLGWALEVDSADAGRALRTLRIYHAENRGWRGVFVSEDSPLAFHAGVLAWCFLMLVVFWAAETPGSRLEEIGVFSTADTARGQWWRPLTATFLHSGLDHLMANLATGFLLLGLAMGRFGAGTTLLASLLAGVGGNLLAWLWRGRDYTGLGSSGVVMGALGMLTVSMLADARAHRLAPAVVVRGMLGGIALFILLGTSPRSDVLAHAGGFLSGAVLAGVLSWPAARVSGRRSFDVACAAGYVAVSALGWLVALR